MPRNDIAYLRHILDAINRIEEYLHEVTGQRPFGSNAGAAIPVAGRFDPDAHV
jgi:uncharacterized protein with HEPN domain